MFLAKEISTCTWNRSETILYLKTFLYKSQWERIDNRVLEQYDESEEVGNRVVSFLQRVMDNSNGALEIYGPAEYLYKDVHRYIDPIMADELNYKDSMLRCYMTKHGIFKHIVQITLGRQIQMVDGTLYDLLIDTFAGRVDRQLRSAYDIITSDAVTYVEGSILKYIRENWNKPQANRSNEWRVQNSSQHTQAFLDFWKFEDIPTDREIKTRLIEYIENFGAGVTYEAFLQTRVTYKLLDFILTQHNYVFNTFEAAERESSAATGKKFDVFIRLFHDRNEKYLFRKDVVNEVTKTLKKKYNGKLDVPAGFLKIEDASDIEEGRYFLISYSEYLQMMDNLKLDRNAITLVNVEVKRTRHLTVPIISPYGTECKPLVDIFYEILNILTIELQVWSRVWPGQFAKVEEIILMAMVGLLDIRKPQHMVSVKFVDRIGNYLREKLGKLLEDSRIPFQKELQEPFTQPKPLTWLLLFEEITENWGFVEHMPFMNRANQIVLAKARGFQGPTFVSRLELTMLVQECISLCVLRKVPGMLHCLRLCNLVRESPCPFCTLTIRDFNFPDTLVPVRKEFEFQIKFDYFGNDDVCHASFLEKNTRKKLVTSEMARSFIFHLILQDLPTDFLRNNIKKIYAKELKNKWRKSRVEIYMTAEEMLTLSSEVTKKYRAACALEVARVLETTSLDLLSPEMQRNVYQEYIFGVEDWIKFLNRRVESLTSIAQVFPDRVFHLKCTRDGHVNAGEVLEVVKLLMDQNADGMLKKHWDAFEKLKIHCYCENGWREMPIPNVQKILKALPVNPERFQFVPDINNFFWNLVKDGLRSSDVQKAHITTPEAPEVAEQVAPTRQEAPTPSEQPAGESGEAVTLSKEHQLVQQLVQNYLDSNPQFIAQAVENSPQVTELRNKVKETQNEMQDAVKEAVKVAKEASEELEETKEAMRRAAVKNEEELKALKEKLKSRDAEIEKLKTELASRPKSYKDDPAVVKQLESRDQKILALEHQLLDKDDQLKCVENGHKIQIEAIHTGLAKYIEEKELLEKRLAEAVAKIAELEEQITVINHQKEELARSTESFKQQFEQETMKNNSMQQELQQLQTRHLATLQTPSNPYAPSTSGTGSIPADPRVAHLAQMQQPLFYSSHSPRMPSRNVQMNSSRTPPTTTPPTQHPNNPNPSASTIPRAGEHVMPLVNTTSSYHLIRTSPQPPAPVTPPPTPQRNDPPPSECGICFEKIHKRQRKTNCNVCKAQWHTRCINQWTAANPTCPMCRTNFPNPEQFPPLGSR